MNTCVKRACVNVGIGRELYTAPFIWIASDKCKIQQKRNGNGFECYDKFAVTDIGYDKKRNINKLAIVNQRTKMRVFDMGVGKGKTTTAAQSEEKPPQNEAPKEDGNKMLTMQDLTCCECQKPLTSVTGKDGNKITIIDLRDLSYKKFGKVLCADCMKKVQG